MKDVGSALVSEDEMDAPPSSQIHSLRGFSLLPFAPVEDLVGTRFRVQGLVGRGGTAEVFLARDLEGGDLVVIKRLKPEIPRDSELFQRFLLEADALRLVSHPAVIRVLEIHVPDDEPPFLVLEPLKGESLGDFLKREGQLHYDEAIQLMREIAHALEAVHKAGVVHRDLKPDNIFLVGPVGELAHVKLLDFGMALLSSEEQDENSTSILGTVQYMAPEQILVEPVDERTDIYALGVLLFRMVTGHLPFDAPDKKDLVSHQLFSPVPPASWLIDWLPPAIDAVIARATKKNPAHRYPHISDFGHALDEIVGLVDPRPALTGPEEPDRYPPVSAKGAHALRVLARAFGPSACLLDLS